MWNKSLQNWLFETENFLSALHRFLFDLVNFWVKKDHRDIKGLFVISDNDMDCLCLQTWVAWLPILLFTQDDVKNI